MSHENHKKKETKERSTDFEQLSRHGPLTANCKNGEDTGSRSLRMEASLLINPNNDFDFGVSSLHTFGHIDYFTAV